MSESFVSLMYHNVVSDDDAATRADYSQLSPSITGYFVAAERFALQLDAVTNVADVMTYRDLQHFYAGPRPRLADPSRSLVQLTFDDGWRGSVDVAGPLLAERGLQALVFVTTGLIGRPHFLNAQELVRLPRETFHIGSHTVTHPFLNELDDVAITDELYRSKAELEDIVGDEVDSLSIPNGAADNRVLQIAEDCGYRYVCVSSAHRNSVKRGPHAIGRVAIRAGTTVEQVRRYASGYLSQERLRGAVLSFPKRVLGPMRYRQLRGVFLGEAPATREMCDLLQLGEAVEPRPAPSSQRVVSSGIKP